MLGVLRAIDKAMNYVGKYPRSSKLLRMPLPQLVKGIEESMLVVFLVANLLTGLINMTLRPLLRPQWPDGVVILGGYCLVWMLFSFALAGSGAKLKFW